MALVGHKVLDGYKEFDFAHQHLGGSWGSRRLPTRSRVSSFKFKFSALAAFFISSLLPLRQTRSLLCENVCWSLSLISLCLGESRDVFPACSTTIDSLS